MMKLSDEAQLAQLGYSQDLRRSLSGFSNFAISFSVISILTGSITLYGYGLQTAGPFGILAGWCLVSLMSLPIVLSMAEMASSFPTAGALYHWASFLGNKHWGWFTAWFNYLGQFAITAGIDYGFTEFVVKLLHLPEDPATKLSLYAATLFSHAFINHYGIRWIAAFNQISAWYHLVGVAALIGVLLYFAPLQPLAFLCQKTSTLPYAYPYVFCLGLLQAQWTLSGYDASAHVSEETLHVSEQVPKGMVLSVVSSAGLGLLMLMAITLAVSDLGQAMKAENPFIFILEGALGPRLGTAMVWLCVVAMWFCGLSSLTSNSRMLYAFARDGGVPYSAFFSRVSTAHQIPVVAVWTSAVAAFLLVLSNQGYSVVVALSTIFIFTSYLIPIALAWRAQTLGRWKLKSSFSLGRWSRTCNVVAVLWIAFIILVLVAPPNYLTLYSSLSAAGALIMLYLVVGKKFAGVPVQE